jgi:hypothetical protein
LLELAKSVGLKRPRPIVEQVRLAVGRFYHHAEEVGLPRKVTDQVARALGVETVMRGAHTRRR